MELKICSLYGDVLDFNGDRGNLICLEKRLAWRGIGVEIKKIKCGDELRLSDFDLVYMGGGADMEHSAVSRRIKGGDGAEIRSAVADGLTFLAVCGGYQLMGTYCENSAGQALEGIGAAEFYTKADKSRFTGNYSFDCGGIEVIGFENHSGRTYLGSGVSPLGTLICGSGNNGQDKTEGARFNNLFCTYAQGPVLPKNPLFADLIIKTALERKYGSAELEALEDSAENLAHEVMAKRLK